MKKFSAFRSHLDAWFRPMFHSLQEIFYEFVCPAASKLVYFFNEFPYDIFSIRTVEVNVSQSIQGFNVYPQSDEVRGQYFTTTCIPLNIVAVETRYFVYHKVFVADTMWICCRYEGKNNFSKMTSLVGKQFYYSPPVVQQIAREIRRNKEIEVFIFQIYSSVYGWVLKT